MLLVDAPPLLRAVFDRLDDICLAMLDEGWKASGNSR
jgi:hypothetical protein